MLGKGPYVLSTSYKHLAVKGAVWSEMKLPERENHLAKLGTSNSFVEEEYQMKKPFEGQSLIGSFQESGLPEFLKGFWRNANKIYEIDRVGPFPNDVNKQNSSVCDKYNRPYRRLVKMGRS